MAANLVELKLSCFLDAFYGLKMSQGCAQGTQIIRPNYRVGFIPVKDFIIQRLDTGNLFFVFLS